MAQLPRPEEVSYLSTSVVAKALGLEPAAVRAMIEVGSLPSPQWMTLGRRVERIYSLEWLVLAAEQLNLRRLPGFEEYISPDKTVQFAMRFQHSTWTVEQIATGLAGLQNLWDLCAEVLADSTHRGGGGSTGVADGDESALPKLNVRRLTAGSPLDLLAWVTDNWQGAVFGVGGVASLYMFVLRNPHRLGEAVPRIVSAWHAGWAAADDNKVKRLEARARRLQFEARAAEELRTIGTPPRNTSLAGPGVRMLENDTPAISGETNKPKPIAPTEGDQGTATDTMSDQ